VGDSEYVISSPIIGFENPDYQVYCYCTDMGNQRVINL